MSGEPQQAGGQNAGAGEAAVRRIQLPIAKPFDGKHGESWPKWRQCFEHRRLWVFLSERIPRGPCHPQKQHLLESHCVPGIQRWGFVSAWGARWRNKTGEHFPVLRGGRRR